jgi:hypothetical protein
MSNIEQLFTEALHKIESMFQNLEFEDDSDKLIAMIEDSKKSVKVLTEKIDNILKKLDAVQFSPFVPELTSTPLITPPLITMTYDQFSSELIRERYSSRNLEKTHAILKKYAPTECQDRPLHFIPAEKYHECLEEFRREFKQ